MGAYVLGFMWGLYRYILKDIVVEMVRINNTNLVAERFTWG